MVRSYLTRQTIMSSSSKPIPLRIITVLQVIFQIIISLVSLKLLHNLCKSMNVEDNTINKQQSIPQKMCKSNYISNG